MEIKCWGSRGSIPVSGSMYVAHGGDTTCMEIRPKSGHTIIVDAGTGIRRLGNKLMGEENRDVHLIFTHVHWDHVVGFPFFKPIYQRDVALHIYRCPFSDFLEKALNRVMKPPYFPVRFSEIPAKTHYQPLNCPEPFEIGSLTIVPVHLSHPNHATGFKFIEDGKTFVFMTDNELDFHHARGLSYDEYVAFAQGADLLIHDGEYTPEEYERYRSFGHTTYEQALDLGLDAGVGTLGLFHLNQDRTDRDMRRIVKACRRRIRQQKRRLECVAVKADMTFKL